MPNLSVQVREVDRQKERQGELDLDATSILREKEEQLQRKEEWIESYKTKIEVKSPSFDFAMTLPYDPLPPNDTSIQGLEKARMVVEDEKAKLKEEKKGLEKQIRDLLETVSKPDYRCVSTDHVRNLTCLISKLGENLFYRMNLPVRNWLSSPSLCSRFSILACPSSCAWSISEGGG